MRLMWGEILSRATEMCGGRRDWSQSDVSFWANLAYADVCGHARFRGLESVAVLNTTEAQPSYTLPCDFDYEQVVTVAWSNSSTTNPSAGTTQRVLMKRNPLQLEQNQNLQNSGQTGGKPYYYTVYGDAIELAPTPDSAYSMEMKYWAKPSTISLEAAYPLIDDRWHPAILFKTAEYLENSRGDIAGARAAATRYFEYVNSIPNDDALRAQARYGQAASFPVDYFYGSGSAQ